MRKRFKDAIKAAGVRSIRFHEYADPLVMPTWPPDPALEAVIST